MAYWRRSQPVALAGHRRWIGVALVPVDRWKAARRLGRSTKPRSEAAGFRATPPNDCASASPSAQADPKESCPSVPRRRFGDQFERTFLNLIKGHGSLTGAIRPKPEQAGRSAKSAPIFEHLLVEASRPDRPGNPSVQD